MLCLLCANDSEGRYRVDDIGSLGILEVAVRQSGHLMAKGTSGVVEALSECDDR